LAETAYIQADVDLASNGIDISSSGFSDSIPTFLYQLFKLIKEFDVKAYHHNFEQIVTKTKQKLENFKRQPPYQQVYSYQSVVLKSGGSFEPEQLYNVLQHITFEDLVKFQTNWLRNVRFEWLISGNIPVGTATELVSQVESIMAANILPKEDILEQRTINIPSG
jgi:secreted Zn-dependent insulinase-like peptidase